MKEEEMTMEDEKVKTGHRKEQSSEQDINMNDMPSGENSFENNEEKPEKVEAETFVSVAEFVKLKYQLAEMINRYRQLEHEFENYRVRTKQEVKQAKTEGVTKAIETILPALDSFKKAKALITDKGSLSGVALIERSLLNSLEKLNIKYIDCIGKEFNPDFHNAVMLVEDKTKEPNTIVDELEMGFTLNDKVIKYSQVIVSK